MVKTPEYIKISDKKEKRQRNTALPLWIIASVMVIDLGFYIYEWLQKT